MRIGNFYRRGAVRGLQYGIALVLQILVNQAAEGAFTSLNSISDSFLNMLNTTATTYVASNPTLRPGDIVATNDGLANFRGKTAAKTAEFTPIDKSSGAWAQKLSDIKVRPAPPAPQVAVAPVEDKAAEKPRRDRRRVQFVR